MKKIFIIGLMFTFFSCNSKDDKVTDDELIQFSIEIANFKEKIESSNMNSDLKKMVTELKFNYTPDQIEGSGWMRMFMIPILGWFARSYYNKQRDDRKYALAGLKSQANAMMLYMKTNY